MSGRSIARSAFGFPTRVPPRHLWDRSGSEDTQAEALSELLQGFACGEESATLAFGHLGGSPLKDAARRGLARVAVSAILRRIHRDEGGHVRLSRWLAPELADRDAIGAVAENARLGLVDLLARRGAEFERLNVDAERLFARIALVPNGLFR